ncbi:MAG: hypothetical protein JWQ38_154 [Flavipsychrobacter sp.]|nr:hypothetical protein [Flavipsychrobacter sp.]
MTATEALRNQVKKYIDTADEDSLRRVNAILEIDQHIPRDYDKSEWWDDADFVKELDNRYDAMESGEDKGVTVDELKSSIENARQKKYGK